MGITEPYQPPNSAEVTVHTNLEDIEAGGLKVFQSLLDLSYMTGEELKVITGTKMKPNPIVKKGKPGKPAKAPKVGMVMVAKPAKAPKKKGKK